jgi:hypothetical protein
MYNYLKPHSLSNITTMLFWSEAISVEHIVVYFDDRNMISLKRIYNTNYTQFIGFRIGSKWWTQVP